MSNVILREGATANPQAQRLRRCARGAAFPIPRYPEHPARPRGLLCGTQTLQLQAYTTRVKVKLLPPSIRNACVAGAEQREEPDAHLAPVGYLNLTSSRLSTVFVLYGLVALLLLIREQARRCQCQECTEQEARNLEPKLQALCFLNVNPGRAYSTLTGKSRLFHGLAQKTVHIFVTRRCRACACRRPRGRWRACRRRYACQRRGARRT